MPHIANDTTIDVISAKLMSITVLVPAVLFLHSSFWNLCIAITIVVQSKACLMVLFKLIKHLHTIGCDSQYIHSESSVHLLFFKFFLCQSTNTQVFVCNVNMETEIYGTYLLT